jgi:hypothetical protein
MAGDPVCYGPSTYKTLPPICIVNFLMKDVYFLDAAVKTSADIIGFILISATAMYLAYKAAVYKGPR